MPRKNKLGIETDEDCMQVFHIAECTARAHFLGNSVPKPGYKFLGLEYGR
jgi:hypothetical protein